MSEWRPFEPSRETCRDASDRAMRHPESCVCGGAGWLWGHELKRPPEVVTDTRYSCDQLSLLDCDRCGAAITGRDQRPGWYHDGEDILCTDCGASNSISCDGESDPYVSGYVCRHGKPSDEPCDQCEIEDSGGGGEVVA